MGRFGRVPLPPLPPQLERVAVVLVAGIALVLIAALGFELLLTRSAALYLRLTGHRPPRKTWFATELDRMRDELEHGRRS